MKYYVKVGYERFNFGDDYNLATTFAKMVLTYSEAIDEVTIQVIEEDD